MAAAPPGEMTLQRGCRHVDVGGYRLHGCVTGSRGPVIVLDAGAGYGMETWEGLVPELSGAAVVVTFDRAGLGRSDPGPVARTPQRIAEEIHLLLSRLDVRPDILVGHSAGGLHVLQYAASHPEGVAAVVLLDTPGPGFRSRWRASLTPERRRRLDRLDAERMRGYPEGVRQDLLGARRFQELDLAGFPSHVRLVAIVADAHGWDSGAGMNVEHLWLRLQRRHLALADESQLIVAHGAGHMVHHERPDLVLGVLRELVASLDAPAPSGELTERARRPG